MIVDMPVLLQPRRALRMEQIEKVADAFVAFNSAPPHRPAPRTGLGGQVMHSRAVGGFEVDGQNRPRGNRGKCLDLASECGEAMPLRSMRSRLT